MLQNAFAIWASLEPRSGSLQRSTDPLAGASLKPPPALGLAFRPLGLAALGDDSCSFRTDFTDLNLYLIKGALLCFSFWLRVLD